MNILKSICQLVLFVILFTEIIFCSDVDQEEGEEIHLLMEGEGGSGCPYGTVSENNKSALDTEITNDDLWEDFNLIKEELPHYLNEDANPFFSHNVVYRLRRVKEYMSKLTEIDSSIKKIRKSGKPYDYSQALEVESSLKQARLYIGAILQQGKSVRFSPVFAGMGGDELLDELFEEFFVEDDYRFRYRKACWITDRCYSCFCFYGCCDSCCCVRFCCGSCCFDFCNSLILLGYDFCQSLVRDAAVFSLLLGGATSLLGWGSYEIYQQHWNSTGF